MNGLAHRDSDCTAPDVRVLLTDYCFGDATPSACDEVQKHLLECETCWNEVRRLEAGARTLRLDRGLAWPPVTPEMVGLLGLSGELTSPLAGHFRYGLFMAGLYAALFAAGLLNEVGFLFDRYGTLGLRLSPVLFLWTFGSLLASLAVDVRAVRHARSSGLPQAAFVLTVAVAVLLVGLVPWLPSDVTVRAAVQAGTVQSSFVKDVVFYFLPVALIIVLPTFHVVVTLQRELAAGRHRMVLALLSGEPQGISPRGCMFIKPWVIGGLLIPAALWAIGSTFYFLGQLAPGPHLGLFTILLVVRIFLWFLIAVSAVAWYQHSLNLLKWECLAVQHLSPNTPAHSTRN